MEHLALEIFNLTDKGSKYAALNDDDAITITDTSEIFASGDVWSHSFQLNVYANQHIFGTAGDLHGSRLHELIDKRRARLWVEGVALYLGYLKLADEAEVDAEGNIDVTFESGQKTFEDMIEGGKANQVPMMSDVLIGMALWRKRKVSFKVRLTASPIFDSTYRYTIGSSSSVADENGNQELEFEYDGEEEGNSVQLFPRMVFPKGEFMADDFSIVNVDCVNTDYPYDDGHPFCNVALCYQKQGYKKKDEAGNVYDDYSIEPEAEREYEYMPANRVNSAPNFYVIYWLRALMKHLGIHIEENQMMDVEDLRRLFFVNTKADYYEPAKLRSVPADARYGKFTSAGGILDYRPNWRVPEYIDRQKTINTKDSGFETSWFDPGEPIVPYETFIRPEAIPTIDRIKISLQGISDWTQNEKLKYIKDNDYYHRAFATSDCFPDADISEVIKAIENVAGVRLLFDGSYQRVRIVLLRNLFRSSDVQDIPCDIIGEPVKQESNIRGFRLTYGDSEDTTFYYKGFADKLPHKKPLWMDNSDKHDYSHWSLDADYARIIKKVTAFDKTCYVTANNGNAFGIKVDKDAKRLDQLHPSLFEFAGYMDAEDGDCTGEEDTIETIDMGFSPAIMNDLNMEAERGNSETPAVAEQRFALFVDETMKPRRPDLKNLDAPASYNDPDAIYNTDKLYEMYGPGGTEGNMTNDGIVKPGEFAITSDMSAEKSGLKTLFKYYIGTIHMMGSDIPIYAQWNVNMNITGHVLEGYRLYLQDNYDPNDDGIAPVETHDWGLTLGIMRGSGEDAHVQYSADEDDFEENDTWEIMPGSNATAHPDTCDCYGNLWDYNGSIVVNNNASAIAAMQQLWPDSNVDLIYYGSVMRNRQTLLCIFELVSATDENGESTMLLFAASLDVGNGSIWRQQMRSYAKQFNGMTRQQMMQYDQEHRSFLVETDSSWERMYTLEDLQLIAFYQMVFPLTILIDNGTGTTGGRFSLKLRAEKPNPYYDTTLPDVITNKADAGKAMQKLYVTSSSNLLSRPTVTNAALRAAGWDCPGDGSQTIFGVIYDVQDRNGETHKVLFTPIRTNSVIMTQQQLENYITVQFRTYTVDRFQEVDQLNMILDIDTTEKRADILQQLQALYYAQEGEATQSVDISVLRYLEITTPALRNRGIMDTFYKEYSYWKRNARVATVETRMELAQLLAIDKTKRVRVGDIMGFIRKIQYSVSNKTGLGNVTMEIMYI